MTDDDLDDARLRRLLADAVSDVEPSDALADVRAQIRSDAHPSTATRSTPAQEAPMARSTRSQQSSGSWTYAFTGALLAAAVIAAVFLLVGNPLGDDPDPDTAAGPSEGKDPSTKPGKGSTPTPVATQDPSAEPGQPGDDDVAAVYYVGITPDGPKLYREFQRAEGPDGFARAVTLLQRNPQDPDYMPLWPEGSLTDASYDGDVIRVSITSSEYRMIPAGVDESIARAAVESVIYTLQGAAQDRAPVQFMLDGNPVDQVYGVPTSEPLANGPILETLNHVSITEPTQASTQSGKITISGVGNSFEANLVWKVVSSEGKSVADGFVTAEGWMEEKLFPWEGTVDLTGLEPGSYTLVVETDDASGGAEGPGAAVDTKDFTVG